MMHGLVTQTEFCVCFIALWSQNMSFQTLQKLSVFKSFFVPSLTYGHECWVMTWIILSQVVACRDLLMPGATAWLDAPLPNSSIEQWRMAVIVTGCTLFVTSQYDDIFTLANQRFVEVCWHTMHIQGRWSSGREAVSSPRGTFRALPPNKAPSRPNWIM